jgi:hypothetical protein
MCSLSLEGSRPGQQRRIVTALLQAGHRTNPRRLGAMPPHPVHLDRDVFTLSWHGDHDAVDQLPDNRLALDLGRALSAPECRNSTRQAPNRIALGARQGCGLEREEARIVRLQALGLGSGLFPWPFSGPSPQAVCGVYGLLVPGGTLHCILGTFQPGGPLLMELVPLRFHSGRHWQAALQGGGLEGLEA